MRTDLVELARLPSDLEAALLRNRLEDAGIQATTSGESLANWCWHFGPTISGVGVLVRREDVAAAQEACVVPGTAGDVQKTRDEAQLPQAMIRAWRASIIGFLVFPPLLHLLSIWLLVQNRFFLHRLNWRIGAACLANAVAMLITMVIALSLARPARAPVPRLYTENGEPIDVQYEVKRRSIHLIP